MTTLLVITWIIIVIALIAILAVRPKRTRRSMFELERHGDTGVIRREVLLDDIMALRRFVAIIMTITLSGLAVALWQLWGFIAAIAAIAICLHVSRLGIVVKRVNQYYEKYEPILLDTFDKYPFISSLLASERHTRGDQQLESTQQLLHLVESAGHVLTDDQQRIISQGLTWHTTTVDSVMTHRADIISVKHSELLGPLVLHDLHETGHSVFPVVKKDIDHIIGTVNIVELLQVDRMKSSHTAEKMMNQGVVNIASAATLPEALELLVSSRQPLLIALDSDGVTSGLVTLRDVLDALLGKNRGEVVK